jgi:hypothetical protein
MRTNANPQVLARAMERIIRARHFSPEGGCLIAASTRGADFVAGAMGYNATVGNLTAGD